MHIVEPEALVVYPAIPEQADEDLRACERYGRLSHDSQDRITEDSYRAFLGKYAIEQGHESILEHRSMTIEFTCSRITSHQLVRHRIAAYTQQSSRFRRQKDVGFVAPELPTSWEWEMREGWRARWEEACVKSENDYHCALAAGMPTDEARYFLMSCEATVVAATMNLRQWRHVFEERAVSPYPSKEMRKIMRSALGQASYLYDVIFDDLFVKVPENKG